MTRDIWDMKPTSSSISAYKQSSIFTKRSQIDRPLLQGTRTMVQGTWNTNSPRYSRDRTGSINGFCKDHSVSWNIFSLTNFTLQAICNCLQKSIDLYISSDLCPSSIFFFRERVIVTRVSLSRSGTSKVTTFLSNPRIT